MIELKLESEFQESVATQLMRDGIGKILDDSLILEDEKIYNVDADQLTQFSDLVWFDGEMKVDYQLPNKFTLLFYDVIDGVKTELSNTKVDGCKLISKDEKQHYYILPESMFQLAKQVTNHLFDAKNFFQDPEFWNIIEQAKNNEDERISLSGLPPDEVILKTQLINIDVEINSDNSATIIPHIPGLSDDKNKEFKYRVLESHGLEVLGTEHNGNANMIRYILDEDIVEAYKRVYAVGTIPEKDVYKFFKNPAAFILRDEESIEDFPISFDTYRIIGMGLPYEGYFGSSTLDDSPLIAALISECNDEAVKDFKHKIVEFCNGKTVEEINQIKNQLKTAQICQDESCIVGEDEEGNGGIKFIPVTYPIGIDVIEQIIDSTVEGPKHPNSTLTKLVINIQPNDEINVSLENDYLKNLDEITQNNRAKSEIFESIKLTPKSYQIAGVNWLIELYEYKFKGALLADDMGLGKTYQVIAFLAYLYKYSSNYKGNNKKRVLIVAPTILLDNWFEEINKFLDSEIYKQIKIHIVRGSDLRNRKEENITSEGTYNSFNVSRFLERETDVIITNYETISNYQFSFANKLFNWGSIIYDEAHKIKNPNSQISQAARAISSGADFNILLTGTPIENELRDLWALFDVFDPSHFGNWKTFRQNYVQNSQNADFRLRRAASNYLMRRLKKDHLKDLPRKIVKEHIVPLTEDEAETYNIYKQDVKSALERLHKLKAFSLYGNLLLDSLNPNLENKPINLIDFSKTRELLYLLESIKQKNEKVIIFCINQLTQNILQYGIKKYFGIEINIINGNNNNSERVEKVLKNFNNTDGFDVLILSTIAAGVGLTITSANHVIHYDRWWNASKEDQASDRVYRIGQEKDVYIHYLISKHPANDVTTIDEAVNDLIKQKRETAGFLIPPEVISTGTVVGTTIPTNLAEKISTLNPKEFEILVMRIYQHRGYMCYLTPDGKREYGADIIATKDNYNLAIQCKHSSKNLPQKDNAVVQLIIEAKDFYKADKLIAVTNSTFSDKARDIAAKSDVVLIEGDELFQLVKKYNLLN